MKSYFFRIAVLFFAFSAGKVSAQQPSEKPESLYPKKETEKTGFYNFLWGKHYRELYALDISAPEISDENSKKLIPVTEGYPYFRFFPEFEKLYKKEQFEETYTDKFVADAYTLIHPLSFVITDGLSRNLGLNRENNRLFYRNGKLHKSINEDNSLLTTDEVLIRLEKNSKIDEKIFVRSRLLDMIVGNSLPVNDSYLWKKSDKNENVYYPYLVDRGFSFPKKDGLFYGALLNSLGIKNIRNYYGKKLNINKINAHNYVSDLNFSSGIRENSWIEEARFIKTMLTDDVLEGIFAEFPENFQDTESNRELKKALIHRITNIEILAKEYFESLEKRKKHTLEFLPGILLDTDLAIRFGGKFTYTQYNFINQPFSARHELSWNHYYSLLYSGMFPTLNEKMAYTIDVWLTSANHFQNFFGFGNESENYESSFGRDYNRVLLQRFGADVGTIFMISETQKAIVKAGVERYNIIDEQKFHRDDIFQEGELRNKTNFFLNLKGSYEILSAESKEDRFSYQFVPEVGLIVNFRDMNRNVPYLSGALSFRFNPDFNRKYTIASNLKAKALFAETYEFYQAATMGGETGLRGYRNERFSGQQYFVHSTDFRINIGKLTNKVVPLNFEPFIGLDYGRVWYAQENSQKWHTSFGGGLSFKFINKLDTNISYFTSSERPRITLSLGYFF